MLRISASPLRWSDSKAARDMLNVPFRSMSTTVRNPFGDNAAAGARKLPAAPLMSVSSLPKRSTVARTAFATASGCRTSAATASTARPVAPRIAAAVASRTSCLRPTMHTSAPSRA